MALQRTLRKAVSCEGVGVHSGVLSRLVLVPAPEGTGIVFRRTDHPGVAGLVPARFDKVTDTKLGTTIGNVYGVKVLTVEHLMAAIVGCGVTNLFVEINGAEVPIMDGSSAPFVEAIDEAGIRELAALRRFIKVLKPIRVEEGSSFGEIVPHSGFHLDVEIDFSTPLIGRQRMAFEMSPGIFRNELARARTFGFMSDVERLWKAGLSLGANLTNTVAIGDDRIMNREGLRDPQEFVRHKMLDAVGDLSLAGLPILGSFRSVRGGHRLNSLVVQALLADTSAWATVQAPRVREVAPRSFGLAQSATAVGE